MPAPLRLTRWLVLLALLVWAGTARAAESVKARVVSVREGRAYLELERPLLVAVGAEVRLQAGGETRTQTAVVAVSSRYLSVRVPAGVTLKKGDSVVLTGEPRAAAAEEEEEAAPPPPESGRAEVQVGRRSIPRERYEAGGEPEFRKVGFQNRALPEIEPPEGWEPVARRGGPPQPGPAPRPCAGPPEPGAEPAGPPAVELAPANEVRGEVAAGADLADDGDDIHRVTPYARLRLEVRRLGGSDRARLFFNGSIRHPFDGSRDWTGHHREDLVARATAAFFELEAAREGEVSSFTDRIEFAIGRMTIPGLAEAGLVDGVRLGIRMGPVIGFGFLGAATSPNPQREDYDSVVYGGGLRFESSLTHQGSLRISLGGGQERFRLEGERDFVESQLDARVGAFGVRGQLVVDLFDQLRDEQKLRLTTGLLSLYAQFNAYVRMDMGYRELRPAWQADLVGPDRINSLDPAKQAAGIARSDLDPVVLPALNRNARRTAWGSLSFRFGQTGWDLLLRGEYYQAETEESRDAAGGYVALGKDDLFVHDRFSLEFSYRKRQRANGISETTADFYGAVNYLWLGQSVTWGLSVYYRTSNPDDVDDSRYGGRLSFDGDLGQGWGLNLYGSVELTRTPGEAGELFLAGASLRYRF